MTEIRVLDDNDAWRRDYERRIRAAYTAAGLGAAAVERRLVDLLETVGDWTVAGILEGRAAVGYVAVTMRDDNGTPAGRITDLSVDAETDADAVKSGAGPGHTARAWAEQWCVRRGARRVDARITGPAGAAFEGYAVRAQTRVRVIGPAPEPLDGITARPMTPTEYPDWLLAAKASYVHGMVRAGSVSPEEAARTSDHDFAELIPEGLSTPDNTFLVLEAAGEPVGTGWLKHGFLPGVTYGYSLHVNERHRGRGYGRTAMAAGEHATLAAGDSALMFTVWGGNTVAMNLYTSTGYLTVEENRSMTLPHPGSGTGI
ncbi:GNAT family N-acetyltransferase [Streptomyces sp. NBC_01497]|uniref:GNAT family N-acetyltransferase n=1 Tax=Streptomyces sp. NBC_01497 TaxID=2903885 RepID=UPI002E32D24F|nr:GNAT family N-acetyltransferase [Streptomyces sp. NBC_01497]